MEEAVPFDAEVLAKAQGWHWVRMEYQQKFSGLDKHDHADGSCWCCCIVCEIHNPNYAAAKQWSDRWATE